MRFAIVIVMILLLAVIVETQIISIHSESRRTKCETVVDKQTGYIRKATDYEFYDCLSRG